MIPIINYRGNFARFKKGHNRASIGSRYKKVGGYWQLWMPEHNSASKDGRVLEHVYFYEQYHKVCMLSWGVVHHIIPVKDGGSNMPWNLKGMMFRDHMILHHTGNKYNVGRHHPPR